MKELQQSCRNDRIIMEPQLVDFGDELRVSQTDIAVATKDRRSFHLQNETASCISIGLFTSPRMRLRSWLIWAARASPSTPCVRSKL